MYYYVHFLSVEAYVEFDQTLVKKKKKETQLRTNITIKLGFVATFDMSAIFKI